MVNNLKYKGKNGILISYQKDNNENVITFDDVSNIWNQLDEETFEGGRAYIWNEDYVAFFALIASGQGGVFFVWNTNTREFVHYSGCAYCTDAIWINDDIVLLCEVSNYVTPFHLKAYAVPFGTKDIAAVGQRLYSESPEKYHSSEPMSVEFSLDGKKLEVIDADSHHLYSSNVDLLKMQEPKKEFIYLYKNYGRGMNPEKLALQSMIT